MGGKFLSVEIVGEGDSGEKKMGNKGRRWEVETKREVEGLRRCISSFTG